MWSTNVGHTIGIYNISNYPQSDNRRLLHTFLVQSKFRTVSWQNGKDLVLLHKIYMVNISKPQEEVYVHMDNTCYSLGETIWFKDYTRQIGSERLSTLSGTLFVDLLNHDGYIVRQRVLELKDGERIGFFDFPSDSTLFSGFYELRTYTRWQLNWGRDAPHIGQ